MKKKINNLKDLSKEFSNDFKKCVKQTAFDIQDIMEISYEQAIADFYLSYTPIYYIRTGATYYGSDLYKLYHSSGNRYIKLSHNSNTYNAGITVGYENINKQECGWKPYNAETSWVFKRTFEKGIHGNTYRERRKWGNFNKSNSKNWNKIKKDFKKYFRENTKNGKLFLRGNWYKEFAYNNAPKMPDRYLNSMYIESYKIHNPQNYTDVGTTGDNPLSIHLRGMGVNIPKTDYIFNTMIQPIMRRNKAPKTVLDSIRYKVERKKNVETLLRDNFYKLLKNN